MAASPEDPGPSLAVPSFDKLDVSIDNGGDVVRLYLDDPARRNPLGGGMLRAIIEFCAWANGTPAKVVVLAGRGAAFTGGADV
eukprot:gene10016-8885_t